MAISVVLLLAITMNERYCNKNGKALKIVRNDKRNARAQFHTCTMYNTHSLVHAAKTTTTDIKLKSAAISTAYEHIHKHDAPQNTLSHTHTHTLPPTK